MALDNLLKRFKIVDTAGTNEAAVTSSNALKVDLSATGANATAVKVDNSAVTQPVSGTVTANAGTGTFLSRPTDGTNAITKTFDNDSGAGTEYNLGVSLRKSASGGSVELGTSSDPIRIDPTGTTTQPISASSLPLPTGAATAAKQPALGTAGTASSDVITIQGIASMTAVKVDGSGVTQPISAASLPLPSLAATSTKQSDGSQKTQVVDGSGNVIGATSNALDVNIKSSGVTQAVSGTVTANNSTASNLKAQVQQLGAVSSSATLQNAVSATGNGSSLSVDGYASVVFEVTGTFTATVTFQGSRDGGTTFYNINALKLGTDTIATAATTTGLYQAQCAGLTHVRATVTWTSGTSVTVVATTDPLTFAPHSVNVGNTVTVTQTTASNLKVDLSGTAANATAIKVDGSAVTQPVSLASVPTHAVTQSGNWTTRIVGNAGSTVDAAVGAGTAPTNMVAIGGLYNSTEISPTTGQSAALQLDSKGRLRNVIMDAAGNTRGANVNSSNQLSVSVDNNPVLGAGTNAIGKLAANSGVVIGDTNSIQSGTWTVQPGNTANTTPWLVTQSPATSGGLSFAAGSIGATKTAIKASAGQLYGYYFYNSNTSVAYVQVFNAGTGSVTLGSTTPDLSIGIPPASAANLSIDSGLAFGTAITIAVTTTRTGSTGPSNTLDYNIYYK